MPWVASRHRTSKPRQTWKMPSTAWMWLRKALPSPSPAAAPLPQASWLSIEPAAGERFLICMMSEKFETFHVNLGKHSILCSKQSER